MTTNDFDQFVSEYLPQINQTLINVLDEKIDDEHQREFLKYSVLAGGKRLRSLLYLATIKQLDGVISTQDLQIAAGIELIQTYSLVHDDLPAMDNDDYRRGKLTSHKKYSEAIAILVGDALNTLGIQLIASAKISPEKSQEITKIITNATGINGMISGQFLDILGTNQTLTDDETKKLEYQKTGAFFVGVIEMGAVVGNANEIQKKQLHEFAQNFGYAFQIYDDLIDAIKETASAGKTTGKDQIQGKNNFVTNHSVAAAQAALYDLIKKMNDNLSDFDCQILSGFSRYFQEVLVND